MVESGTEVRGDGGGVNSAEGGISVMVDCSDAALELSEVASSVVLKGAKIEGGEEEVCG